MESASQYVARVLEKLKEKNYGETAFHQAATEILGSLELVFEHHPEFIEANLLERLSSQIVLLCFAFHGLMTRVMYR